ncbi:MAG: hypothetical protein JW878_08800 [Methanomicrobia archaeon]|nr:hypothetical protein [Methanomicrobia archaeon]
MVLTLSAIVGTGIVLADDISIRIAPATLNLNDNVGGHWVTVHTDVAFSSEWVCTLNGVAATSTYSDDCGNLVAKFDQAAIAGTVVAGTATLEFTGTKEDEVITGSDTIRVINSGK